VDNKARARAIHSTQEHIEVKDIRDDLIVTKTGVVSMVIQTSAINFDLLAEYEQDNKIYAFAGLLNSLNFRIQILIRTRRIDITNYVEYLRSKDTGKMSEGLKKQLEIYTTFIQKLIVQNDVLDKSFYIIIPYSPGSYLPNTNIFKSKKDKEKQEESSKLETEQLVEKAKIFLQPKRDHVLKQLGRMGLVGHQLTTKELLTEIYTIYNPEEEDDRE